MNKYQVRSAEDALSYLVDCTLATVADMAMKKSKPAYEFKRQISIAQTGLDWMVCFGVKGDDTRAKEVRECYGGSVADWAKQYHQIKDGAK